MYIPGEHHFFVLDSCKCTAENPRPVGAEPSSFVRRCSDCRFVRYAKRRIAAESRRTSGGRLKSGALPDCQSGREKASRADRWRLGNHVPALVGEAWRIVGRLVGQYGDTRKAGRLRKV